MDIRLARLTARVKAANQAHAYAATLYANLFPIFSKFVGQKIVTALTGDLLAKIKKLMPELENDRNLRVWRVSGDYSLAYGISVNEMVDDRSCIYFETTVYFGSMQYGVLTKMTEFSPLRYDYTVEEILQKRAEYEKAKKLADDAKSALYPFGESDHN